MKPSEIPCPTCFAPKNYGCRDLARGGQSFAMEIFHKARIYHAKHGLAVGPLSEQEEVINNPSPMKIYGGIR